MPGLNYWVGKSLAGVRDAALRRRLPGLDARYPRGRVMPLDVARFAAADGGGPICRVLDVGANDGGTSLALAAWFPEAEFYAFEPIAATFASLERRVAENPRIMPLRLACGAEPGEVTVTLRSHDTINTLRDARPIGGLPADQTDAGTKSETVTVTTVDAHCPACGWDTVDLLKTDTEGFDLEVLRGAERLLTAGRVRFVYSEVGFNGQDGQTPFAAVSGYLRGHGFRLAGFYEEMRAGDRKQFLSFANALFVRAVA